MMRIIVAIIGVLVSIGLITVSIMMNFRFGQMLGRTEFDGLIYGLASACADGFKVILPFTLIWAWRNRRLWAGGVSALLFFLFSTYSVTSSLGFSASNRMETEGRRQQQASTLRHFKALYDRTKDQRDRLKASRPEQTLKSLILVAKQHSRWRSTSGCEDVTVEQSRQFCIGYYKLEAELATARQAKRLDNELAGLRKQLSAFKGQTIVSAEIHPQIKILMDISGLDQQRIELILTILLTALVEFGSGFGLFVTFGHGGRRDGRINAEEPQQHCAKEQQLPNSNQDWLAERMSYAGNQKIALLDLYRDYCQWRHTQPNRSDIMTLSQFRALLADTEDGKIVRLEGKEYWCTEGYTCR